MQDRNNLLYITFDIGAQAGNLPQYFKETFDNFYFLSIYLHDLDHEGQNKLTSYKNGQKNGEQIFYTPTTVLPLIYLNIFRIILLTLLRAKKPVSVVSMNPYFLTFSHLLGFLGVKQKYFIVGDSPFVSTKNSWKNRLLKFFFRRALQFSNKLWFLTPKLHHTAPQVFSTRKTFIQPFGLKTSSFENPNQAPPNRPYQLVYIGNLSKEKAGLLLKFLQDTPQKPSTLIIGTGQLKDAFVSLAQRYPTIKYKGPIYEEKKRAAQLNKTQIGIALFNYSEQKYYGDPVKIKLYLQHGLPVITDNSTEISKEIRKFKAGEIVNPESKEEILAALEKIENKYEVFQRNVQQLCKKLDYKKICNQFFEK